MAHNITDNICKTTVEDHTADMLRFFYPNAELIIDFKEFQAYYDPAFSKRMFIYFYRLFDKHACPVTMIIVHTDKSADRCLSSFDSSLLNTDLHFTFKPYKVWEQDENDLMASNNPYAFVILTILTGRKKREKQRMAKGLLLAHTIIKKPFNETSKFNLLKFMKLYFHFENPDLRVKFDTAISQLQSKSKTMGIIEYEKMLVRKEALEQGMEQGMERGLVLGKRNIAKNLLQMGLDPVAVHQATELAVDEIKELQIH